MPTDANVYEAETDLSRLLARMLQGERVVIAKAGTPVAELVPYQPDRSGRQPGSARGLIVIHDDFDAPLPADLIEAFDA